jgi:hypothetical protein
MMELREPVPPQVKKVQQTPAVVVVVDLRVLPTVAITENIKELTVATVVQV